MRLCMRSHIACSPTCNAAAHTWHEALSGRCCLQLPTCGAGWGKHNVAMQPRLSLSGPWAWMHVYLNLAVVWGRFWYRVTWRDWSRQPLASQGADVCIIETISVCTCEGYITVWLCLTFSPNQLLTGVSSRKPHIVFRVPCSSKPSRSLSSTQSSSY